MWSLGRCACLLCVCVCAWAYVVVVYVYMLGLGDINAKIAPFFAIWGYQKWHLSETKNGDHLCVCAHIVQFLDNAAQQSLWTVQFNRVDSVQWIQW